MKKLPSKLTNYINNVTNHLKHSRSVDLKVIDVQEKPKETYAV